MWITLSRWLMSKPELMILSTTDIDVWFTADEEDVTKGVEKDFETNISDCIEEVFFIDDRNGVIFEVGVLWAIGVLKDVDICDEYWNDASCAEYCGSSLGFVVKESNDLNTGVGVLGRKRENWETLKPDSEDEAWVRIFPGDLK